MKTLVINLFGGSGIGKSTVAAGVFYHLKLRGVCCELVREYAKDRTWLEDGVTLSNQAYVTSKQIHRQFMVMDKVDVLVTDSPILLGMIYEGYGCTPNFGKWLREVYDLSDNWNFVLGRNLDYAYETAGRSQDLEQSIALDAKLIGLLDDWQLPYEELPYRGEETVQFIVEQVLGRLKNHE